MTGDKKQSYLTEKVVGRINNIVIFSVLLGMCISSWFHTFDSLHIEGGRVIFIIVGLIAFAFIIISLEYLGQFRAKVEVEQ